MLSIRLMVTSILCPCVCWSPCVRRFALSLVLSPCYVSLSSAIDSGATTFLSDIAALLPVSVLFGLPTCMPVGASRLIRDTSPPNLSMLLTMTPPFIISLHTIPANSTRPYVEFRFSLSSSPDRSPRVAIVIAISIPSSLYNYSGSSWQGIFLFLSASFMACDICI
ncbi:hypothetical protein F5141DRAFT_173327 [Pisolithus sp. B1]|nr:hypothetical protein F5141DRAFT_173327 [Pisolithus sp. B1]